MRRPVDLRSDTVTRPTPEMRAAIARADVGDDVFGDDPTVRRLEERTASLLGQEAALFVPSGHMGNEIALHVHGRPGREVIVEELSHIMTAEGGAPAVLAGVTLRPLSSTGGVIDPDRLEGSLVLDDDPHHAPTVLACAENTHNRLGGRVVPPEAFDRLVERLQRHHIPLHLDGARLWNAAAARGVGPDRWASRTASVMVCYSKGLGAPVGSALAGGKEFIHAARRARKLFGGGMRQAGILAAGALFALDHHRERLSDDHRRARRLADLVERPDGVTILGGQPESNILIWDLPVERYDVFELQRRLREEDVWMSDFGPGRLRAVTHLDIDDEQIEHAGRALDRLLREASASRLAAAPR